MKRKRWTGSGTGTGCRRIKLFPREMRKRLKPPQEVEKLISSMKLSEELMTEKNNLSKV